MNEPRKPGADESETAEQLPVAASSLMAMRLTPEMRRAMQVAGATTDGLPKAMQQYKLPLRTWSVPVLAILGLAMVIFVLAFWLNVLTERPGDAHQDGSGLIQALLYQNVDQAQNTLGGLGEVMAAVLGLALTVSSIIVQLAATRFTPHITSLFFRARTNLLVLGFFVVCNVFVLWVNFAIGEGSILHWGVFMSMMVMSASLLLLFPYFAFVFNFLDPDTIVSRITDRRPRGARPPTAAGSDPRSARASARPPRRSSTSPTSGSTRSNKRTRTSPRVRPTRCATTPSTTATPRPAWSSPGTRSPSGTGRAPTSCQLSTEAIGDLTGRGTWLEWKILRQYQMLYGEGLDRMKDLCYLIAINTRRLGEAAARHGDLPALDLAIKFFNTYLRATFNANDIRTCYNILHQYRQLGEYVLEHAETDPADLIMDQPMSMTSTMTVAAGRPAGDLSELEQRGLDIARYMRYYSGIAFGRGMVFITEVIAHDVGAMCVKAFHTQSDFHGELLRDLPSRSTTAPRRATSRRPSRGVRLAQVKLASHLPAARLRDRRPTDPGRHEERAGRTPARDLAGAGRPDGPASSGRSTTAASTSSTCHPSRRPCCPASSPGSRA